jgi:hypothetical protein
VLLAGAHERRRNASDAATTIRPVLSWLFAGGKPDAIGRAESHEAVSVCLILAGSLGAVEG